MATTTCKNKKISSQVSFKQNIKLRKDPKFPCRVYKTYIGELRLKKTCRANLLFFINIAFFVNEN